MPPTIKRKDLPPEDAERYDELSDEASGLVGDIASGLLSGIGMLGSVLDLPGSSIRDLLTFQNPFDQWLSPFSGDNRASGRDVMEMIGFSENKETGFTPFSDPWEFTKDTMGFGVELATDPLGWLTGWLAASGRAARAGKAAGKAAGIADASILSKPRRAFEKFGDVVDRLDPGHRLGMAAYQNPASREAIRKSSSVAAGSAAKGMRIAKSVVRSNRAWKKIAPTYGRAAEIAADSAFKLRVLGRQAFDYRTLNATTDPVQKASIEASAFEDALAVEWRKRFVPLIDEIIEERSRLGEGVDPDKWASSMVSAVRNSIEAKDPSLIKTVNLPDGIAKAAREFSKFHDQMLHNARSEGIRIGRLEDEFVEYLHRQMSDRVSDYLRRNDPSAIPATSAREAQVASAEHQGRRLELFRSGLSEAFDDVTGSPVVHELLDMANSAKNAGDRGLYNKIMKSAYQAAADISNGRISRRMRSIDKDGNVHLLIDEPGVDGLSDVVIPYDKFRKHVKPLSLDEMDPGMFAQLRKETEDIDVDVPSVYRIVEADKSGIQNGYPARYKLVPDGGDMSSAVWADSDDILYWDPDQKKSFDHIWGEYRISEEGRAHVKRASGSSGDEIDWDSVGEIARQKVVDRIEELVKHMYNRPIYAETGGIFASPLQAILSGFRSYSRATRNARVVNSVVEDGLRSGILSPPSPARGERMTLGKLFDSSEFSVMDRRVAYDRLSNRKEFRDKFGSLISKESLYKFIDNIEIDPDIAADLMRSMSYMPKPDDPGVAGAVSNVFQSFTSLFKAGVLTHPARYTRDGVSGQIQNMMHGIFSGRSFRNMFNVLFNRPDNSLLTIPEVKDYIKSRGLPETGGGATKAVREMYSIRRGHASTIYHDLDNAYDSLESASDLKQIERSMLGRHESPLDLGKQIFREAFARTPDSSWKFWDIAGFNNRKESGFGMVRAGELAGKYMDDSNRLVGFIELMRRGVSADEAMKVVNRVQLNYDPKTFTPTEKWLKRIFPFYSFYSREMAYLAGELMTNPAGRLGKLIRLQSKADVPVQEGQYVPEHVREKMALPIGESGDGGQDYLTSLGLMHEDAVADIFGSVGDPKRLIRNLISKTNPLIKGAAEYALGRSSFQGGPLGGRDLHDMDPTIGRILTQLGLRDPLPSGRARPFLSRGFEFAVSNSPFSRIASSTKTLLDDRKSILERALNLLTGMRITTVSPEQSQRAVRDIGDAIARDAGARPFQTFWVTDDLIESLSGDPGSQSKLRAVKRLREVRNQQRRIIRRIEKNRAASSGQGN